MICRVVAGDVSSYYCRCRCQTERVAGVGGWGGVGTCSQARVGPGRSGQEQ